MSAALVEASRGVGGRTRCRLRRRERCASSPRARRWLEPGSESTTRAPRSDSHERDPPVPTFFSLTFDYPRGTLPTGGGGDDARGDTRERGGGYHRGEGGPREVARARVRVVGRPGTRAPRRAQTSRGGDPRGATRRVRVARGGPQSATVRARRVGDGGQRMGRGATENTSSRALSRRRAASQVVHPSLVRRFVDGG